MDTPDSTERRLQGIGKSPLARAFTSLNGLILVVFAVCALYPFLNIFIYVFNDGVDSLKAPLYLWPRKPSLDNMRLAFMQKGILNAALISVLRTVIGTLLSLLATSSLAYAMTKRKIFGYKFFSWFFFITFMFSGGFITFYLTLRQIGLLDTFWVFVIPAAYSYLYMIVFRTFFDSLPASIEESAQMDGASYFTIFSRLVVPLSKPVYAAVALFFAIGQWNDWFSGLFYVRKEALTPLQTLLQRLILQADLLAQAYQYGSTVADLWTHVTPYSIRLAVVVISITPIIMVYPFLQKHFVKGIMLGAIKG